MLCGACGVAVAPGSTTCPNCGAAVETTAGWPGGYPAGAPGPYPGYPPTGMLARTYNLDGLASALVVMLVITAVTSLIGSLFTPILIIMFLLLVPLVVVFLVWFYRARQNAGQMDWRQRWSPPWAVFGWVVPICFLWFPYQIMADIWRAGHPAPERTNFPFLPAAWWACWCLAWFTGYRHVTRGTPSFSTTTYTLAFGGTLPSRVFAAVAAVLLAFIVKRVSEGPVGSVGKLAVRMPWQPGVPTPGQH